MNKPLKKSLTKETKKELVKVMATEIKSVVGDKLIQEVVEDVGIEALEKSQKRKYLRKTKMMPKELIEGMFTTTITELKNGLDAVFLIFFDKETGKSNDFNTQKKKLDAVKATLVIFLHHLDTVEHCLSPYSEATMNVRHRRVRKVCAEGLRRLRELELPLSKAKNMNNSSVTQFAKEITLFLSNFHVTFHRDTPKKETNRIVKEYCISEEL